MPTTRPHVFSARFLPSRRARPTRTLPRPSRAFTLVELLVVIGIIAILISILIGSLTRARRAARNSACCSNLRQIAIAFVHYALDNKNHLPNPVGAEHGWEDFLHKYAPSLDIYHCPADEDLFAAFNSSYDWRDTGDPDTTLAGRALSDVRRAGVVLAYEALPGWHYKHTINIVRVDGSVSTVPEEECFADLATPVRPDVARDLNVLPSPGGPSP